MRIDAAILAAAVLAVLFTCGPAGAQDEEEFLFSDLSLGPKIGTLGVGGEVTSNLMTGVNLRASYQWLKWDDYDVEIENIDYTTEINLSNPMFLLDWYPDKEGAFRFSIGVLLNRSDLIFTCTPTESIPIGDTLYTPTQVGTLRGETDFAEFVPYIGIGFGNTLSRDGHWSFSADLGVAFLGIPDVVLSATGTAAGNTGFKQDLAREEEYIEDYIDVLRYYPVVSLALCYRF